MTHAQPTPYALRALQRKDFPAVVKLQQRSKPLFMPWTPGQLESHHRVFCEGQWLIEDPAGQLVGVCSTLIVNAPLESPPAHWRDQTGNGYFHTHTLRGNTLYVADLTLDPVADTAGARQIVYEALREQVRERGLVRLLSGGRLPGYAEVAQTMEPVEYVTKVMAGQAEDPVLSVQLAHGFRVVALMTEPDQHIRQVRQVATVIEWRPEPKRRKTVA